MESKSIALIATRLLDLISGTITAMCRPHNDGGMNFRVGTSESEGVAFKAISQLSDQINS